SKTRTANAGALMVILYGPGWRSLNRYTPRSSVDTSRATPVALFRASTLAVGTAAPEGSVTLPVSDPYSTWAWREEPSDTASKTAAETTLRRKARADMAVRIWALLYIKTESGVNCGGNAKVLVGSFAASVDPVDS